MEFNPTTRRVENSEALDVQNDDDDDETLAFTRGLCFEEDAIPARVFVR